MNDDNQVYREKNYEIASDNESIVSLRNVTKRYSNTYALNDISLNFSKGKIIGLLGENGSGKTTLIKILTNLINNYTGEVLIDGEKPGPKTKEYVSYLPDSFSINPQWNFYDAIKFYKDFYKDFDEEKALKIIGRLNLHPEVKMRSLSKGTKDKVQLALTLSRNAKVFLFDEPIAGVDPAAREFIFKMIIENCNPSSTIIICTHLVSDVEEILEEVVFLRQGKVILSGDVKKMRIYHQKSIDQLFREVYRC